MGVSSAKRALADLTYSAPSTHGQGLYAAQPLQRGQLVAIYRPGVLCALPMHNGAPNYGRWCPDQTLDVAVDGSTLWAMCKPRGWRWRGAELINHGCGRVANCTAVGLAAYAKRRIRTGEELRLDYITDGLTLVPVGVQCTCRPGCPNTI